ncbi:hypothetical protein E2C01_087678 [Portunus trituberculatus]|uniref:Uncharacterized protein n=1 Tax=Portunus trituberculatus TaxID=210409 RepID=A0A5B7J8T5_PORTR|nr:hypothetical protein [Portunus trituberculatus]
MLAFPAQPFTTSPAQPSTPPNTFSFYQHSFPLHLLAPALHSLPAQILPTDTSSSYYYYYYYSYYSLPLPHAFTNTNSSSSSSTSSSSSSSLLLFPPPVRVVRKPTITK